MAGWQPTLTGFFELGEVKKNHNIVESNLQSTDRGDILCSVALILQKIITLQFNTQGCKINILINVNYYNAEHTLLVLYF